MATKKTEWKNGDKVTDLSGMQGFFVAWSELTPLPKTKAIIELTDGTLVVRSSELIREVDPEDAYELYVTVSLRELQAISNYPLGSVCNPLVLAARTKLREMGK